VDGLTMSGANALYSLGGGAILFVAAEGVMDGPEKITSLPTRRTISATSKADIQETKCGAMGGCVGRQGSETRGHQTIVSHWRQRLLIRTHAERLL
jgi:hypothetical protein